MQKVVESVLIYLRSYLRDNSKERSLVINYDRGNKAFFIGDEQVLGLIDLMKNRLYEIRYKEDAKRGTFRIMDDDLTLEVLDDLDLPEMSHREVAYHLADYWFSVEKVAIVEVKQYGICDAETGLFLCYSMVSEIASQLRRAISMSKSSNFLVHVIAGGLVYNVASSIRYLSFLGSEKGSYEHAITVLRGGSKGVPFTGIDILNDSRPEVKRLYRMYKELDDLMNEVTNREVV